jgi:hypothetical protein
VRRVLLSLGWLLFVFLLLEGAGFVFYKLEVSKPISGYGYPNGLLVGHPDLGFAYRPNFTGYFKGSAYQHIPIEINAQGFRDSDFGENGGDEIRIAVLGDSVVFGPGVAAEDRFTECLANSERGRQEGWRIMNLGVNSYSLGHYLELARVDFLDTRPDAVLVGITLNDFAPMDSAGPYRRIRRHAEQPHKPDWLARIQERIGRTYAVRFLEELDTRLSYALMNKDEREDYHTKWMRTVVAAWAEEENRERFANQLRELHRLLDDAGIPYGFILFPELNDLKDPDEFGSARFIVKGVMERQRLNYCDPYETFAAAEDLETLFLQRDSVHYSPRGQERLCRALERCLGQGLVSMTATP